jgi:pSer/pThr/pTyr-binding forkhead associated (FHA) protein
MSAEQIDAHDVFGPSLRLWPVAKKPGNPYPDRISVGRATNCDIVLRAPYLSKLHAHFSRDERGAWRLADNDSANGTRVNSARIPDGSAAPVAPGDRVSFGGLELELAGPDELYALLAI